MFHSDPWVPFTHLVPLHRQRLPRRPLRRQIHGRTHRQPERWRSHRDRGKLGHHLRRAERQAISSLEKCLG